MDANTFSLVVTAIGIGLIPVAFYINGTYKQRIDDYVKKESKELFDSEEFRKLYNALNSKNFDVALIDEVYERLSEIDSARYKYNWCFNSCLLSGGCLVLAVFMSGFTLPDFLVNSIGVLYWFGVIFFVYFLYSAIYIHRI